MICQLSSFKDRGDIFGLFQLSSAYFAVYLCVRFAECWRSSGFGQNCSRSCNCRRSIPYCGNDLALGVEKQLRGDSLDLETLEGEGGCRSPSSQGGWVHQQREGSYDL